MSSPDEPLELIWDGLLSRETDQIRAVFAALDPASQRSVLLHLRRMALEPDWLPVQQQSAQFALDTLLPGMGEDDLLRD